MSEPAIASLPGPKRDGGVGAIVGGPGAAVTAGVAEVGRSVDTDGGDCANRGAVGAMRRHPTADQTRDATPPLPGLWPMAVPQRWPNGSALVHASGPPGVCGFSL
jgi:hypothetical protein